jgi:hypothetical protein
MDEFIEEDVDPDAEREIDAALNAGRPHEVCFGEILGEYNDVFEKRQLPTRPVTESNGWKLVPLYSNEVLDGWGVAFVGVKGQRVKLLSLRTETGHGFNPTKFIFQEALADAVERAKRHP